MRWAIAVCCVAAFGGCDTRNAAQQPDENETSEAAAAESPIRDVAHVEEGKAIAFNRTKGNCLACHKIPGGKLAGNVAPPLVNMEARYPEREQLFDRIWNERQFNPRTVMPPFGPHQILTEEEIQKIVDFLYTV